MIELGLNRRDPRGLIAEDFLDVADPRKEGIELGDEETGQRLPRRLTPFMFHDTPPPHHAAKALQTAGHV